MIFLAEVDERGDDAVDAAAETFGLPPGRVRQALNYYASYADEVDAEVDEARSESVRAAAAWEAERRLLA